MNSFLGTLMAGAALLVTSHSSDAEFRIFDATLYTNKSAATKSLRPIALVDEHLWRDKSKLELPPADALSTALVAINPEITTLVLDFEHWPINGTRVQVQDTVDKFAYVIDRIRLVKPNLAVGIYGTLPNRDYWRAKAAKDDSRYREWQGENDRLAFLSTKVDASFPNAYTFYDDPRGWIDYARAQVAEARRLNPKKPVYLFLWPEFHNSTPLGGRYIPRSFWKTQLDLSCEIADGIVIWGGWDFVAWKRQEWDDNASWWDEVKALDAKRSNCTGARSFL